jgi:glucan-binding YG repeat protein
LGEIPFMLSLMDIPNIELKETTEVNITTKGQEVLFKYIPDTTETYIFKSISNNLDTRCTVYNSQFDPIAEKDDSAMDNNFYLEITLEAGETYYLGVSFYKADMLAKFSVLLSKVESPFHSIEAKPITLIEGVHGSYVESYDETTGKNVRYFEYEWPYFIQYTVNLTDGKEINGEGYRFKYNNREYFFSFSDNQSPANQWKPDNTYPIKISLENLSANFEITISHNYADANCTKPKTCKECGATYGEALSHTYDNDCDTICNVCNEERTITHDFRWVIDEMNNCGKEGKQHQECSVCGIVQNENTPIPATNSHVYANDCDTDCDVCAFVREVDNHMYNSVIDKTCDICGAQREVTGQHLIEEGDYIYYYVDGEKSDITSLVKINGKWYYIKDGKFASNETTLVKYSGKWYYVKKGIKDTETTLVKYNGKWYYVEKGLKSTKTTLVKYNGTWYYVKSGVKSTDTTLVKYNDSWYYVEKGVKKTATKLVKYNGSYYYVKNGKWDSSTKGIIKISGKYYYIKGGKWSKTTTLYKKSGKYYAVKSGMWYKSKAIIKYSGKKYYVNKGYAQTKYSGKVTISGKKYTVKKGIVK